MAHNGKTEDFGEFNYQVPVFPRGESEQDAFMTSAPGKVIVFGEHAVVYGKVCFGLLQKSLAAKLIHIGSHGRRNIPSLVSSRHSFLSDRTNHNTCVS